MRKETIEALRIISSDKELLEVGRLAIEDELVDRRDRRIAILFRNNGLVIKERNGDSSNLIRLGPEESLAIGLRAIVKHLER